MDRFPLEPIEKAPRAELDKAVADIDADLEANDNYGN